jgi:hypothetical protein
MINFHYYIISIIRRTTLITFICDIWSHAYVEEANASRKCRQKQVCDVGNELNTNIMKSHVID